MTLISNNLKLLISLAAFGVIQACLFLYLGNSIEHQLFAFTSIIATILMAFILCVKNPNFEISNSPELVSEVVDLTTKQIESTSKQIETAITEMAICFSKIVDRLRHTQEISKNVSEIEVALINAIEVMEKKLKSDIKNEEFSQETLSNLSLVVGGLSNPSQILNQESAEIMVEVEKILVLIQFQDRVSQILKQMNHSLNDFSVFFEEEQQLKQEDPSHVTNNEVFIQKMIKNHLMDEETNMEHVSEKEDKKNLEFF